MDSEIADNYKRYRERKALYLSYGYDMDKERSYVLKQGFPLTKNMLEVGTGKGYLTLALAKERIPFISVDLSAEEQRYARMNLEYWGLENYADLRIADAASTGFNDSAFDLLFSVNLLHHLKNPYRVLDEFVRILSPVGRMVLADFSKEGFSVVDKVLKLDGRIHEVEEVSFYEMDDYLSGNGFDVRIKTTRYQEVLIAQKRGKPL